jgi:hypothetical protein
MEFPMNAPKEKPPFKGGTPREFFFIRANPDTLTGKRVSELLSKCFLIQGGAGAHQRFDRIVAMVEYNGSIPLAERSVLTEFYGIPAVVIWIPTRVPAEVLALKLYDLAQHKRQPGFESTHAAPMLKPRDCPVTIGDKILPYNVDVYFERHEPLRHLTIGAMYSLYNLKLLEEDGEVKDDAVNLLTERKTYLQVKVSGPAADRFYEGNFNKMVEAALETMGLGSPPPLSPEYVKGRLKVGAQRMADLKGK